MKLDETIVNAIIDNIGIVNDPSWVSHIKQNLHSLDLVIKPGDNSQATLVENNDSFVGCNCGGEVEK